MGQKKTDTVSKKPELFTKLETLLTEQRNPASSTIDLADSRTIAEIINNEDKKVAHCVEERLDEIAQAIDLIVEALKKGGRVLYFGAGTSGRLGVLDAAECPPTFGTKPETVQGFIAGGEKAMFRAQEGAEDHEKFGEEEIVRVSVTANDIVIGLAASGRTPYVHGALKKAASIGCKTILVTTVSGDQVDVDVGILVDVPVGPEVIMGSTRMKSATAQKMILNMFTTGAMIRLGKVYENVMVDLQLTNKKLEERAKRIVMTLAEIDYEEASKFLDKADNHVKTALLMALSNLSKDQAESKLQEHDGFIRKALGK
ncbi:MAG: N-acetylmuramic acid 6-phosphate etherase [Balneolaceae bacterium]|nr:N-acetylmuramic acid 6-phosphate etherase [Balneolaceae bacterium]